MSGYLSQPANGQALLGHVNIRVGARSPGQGREQDAQGSSAGSRADAHTGLSPEKAGTDEG